MYDLKEDTFNSKTIKTLTSDTLVFFIAKTDGSEIVHYGKVSSDQTMTTGQEQLIVFENEEEWLSELENLGVVVES